MGYRRFFFCCLSSIVMCFILIILILSSSSKQETEPLTWRFWRKRRYIVVLLSFLGFLSSLSLRVNLNVAIVAMDDVWNRDSFKIAIILKKNYNFQKYVTWTSLDKGLIFSSFFWGYIMTTLVGGVFAKRFGGNVVCALVKIKYRRTFFKMILNRYLVLE